MKKVSDSNEWIEVEDGVGIVGISSYAKEELGDIVHLSLPTVGDHVNAKEEVAVLESTKAAADLYTPVSGEVTAVNETLLHDLTSLNEDPEGEGWLFQILLENTSELDNLLSYEEYQSSLKGESES